MIGARVRTGAPGGFGSPFPVPVILAFPGDLYTSAALGMEVLPAFGEALPAPGATGARVAESLWNAPAQLPGGTRGAHAVPSLCEMCLPRSGASEQPPTVNPGPLPSPALAAGGT